LIHVAGIVDKELNRYSIFNKILATCRQTPTLEEYRTVINSFEDFFKIMEEKGHIPEEHLDVCGIRSDKDINGNDVLRTAGILQESFQHSKCLTHSHQVSMHLEHLQIIISKELIIEVHKEKCFDRLPFCPSWNCDHSMLKGWYQARIHRSRWVVLLWRIVAI
jgi:hypothetical protein